MGNFFKHLFHLVLYIVVFFGLVWGLLGISPDETYIRERENLSAWSDKISSFVGDMGDTASEMKKAGKSQTQEASDRIAGKDSHEEIAKKIDNVAKK